MPFIKLFFYSNLQFSIYDCTLSLSHSYMQLNIQHNPNVALSIYNRIYVITSTLSHILTTFVRVTIIIIVTLAMIIWCQNLVLSIGHCVSLGTQTTTFMSIPYHLIEDLKTPLRTTCTLVVLVQKVRPGVTI